MEISSGTLNVLGGSDTRPTCIMRIKKELRKKTAGDVVKRDRTTNVTAVMASRPHRESLGQSAWEPGRRRNRKDFGNADGNEIDLNPWARLAWYSSAAPVNSTTPQPPFESDIAPAWIAAWQTKLSARYVASASSEPGAGPPTTRGW